jgi:DNA-binding SARP family transcriptional activator
MVRVSLLGPLEIMSGTRELTPTAPKVRQVLALLALRQNHIVQIPELIDELWGPNPPRSALTTLQTYIYLLRQILADDDPGHAGVLSTRPHGYSLSIPPENLDQWRFEQLVTEGQTAASGDRLEQAARALAQALSLWRGPALAGVSAGELLTAHVVRLDEERLQALELRLEVDLRLGRHQGLVGELKSLTTAHPLHEGFHGKLMLALHRSGRRHEALGLFQNFRTVHVRELGLEPTSRLRELHQAVLAADPSLDIQPAGTIAAQPRHRPVPAQLPMDITDFTGRQRELDEVERFLEQDELATGVPIVVVTGMPGVGTSTLAVHAAQRLRGRFPDGQFYTELGGSGVKPADPFLILGQFLRAAGFPATRIPRALSERSAMFRTWAADRRVLVVLDDLDSVAATTPLLPGSPRCAVIATGLTCTLPGAHTVLLDVLSPAEGTRMLAKIAGEDRLAAEPGAAERIVRLCGGLPIAIRAVGARLAVMPGWPLRDLEQRLADGEGRLAELCETGVDVRAGYDSCYRRLGGPEQNALCLLSVLHSGVFGAEDLGTLLSCDAATASSILARLAGHHLLRMTRTKPGDVVCYQFDELTRLYARERLGLALKALGGSHGAAPR